METLEKININIMVRFGFIKEDDGRHVISSSVEKNDIELLICEFDKFKDQLNLLMLNINKFIEENIMNDFYLTYEDKFDSLLDESDWLKEIIFKIDDYKRIIGDYLYSPCGSNESSLICVYIYCEKYLDDIINRMNVINSKTNRLKIKCEAYNIRSFTKSIQEVNIEKSEKLLVEKIDQLDNLIKNFSTKFECFEKDIDKVKELVCDIKHDTNSIKNKVSN